MTANKAETIDQQRIRPPNPPTLHGRAGQGGSFSRFARELAWEGSMTRGVEFGKPRTNRTHFNAEGRR